MVSLRQRGTSSEILFGEGEPATFQDLDPGPVESARAYRRGGYRSTQLTVQLARYVKIRGDLAVGWKSIRHDTDAAARHVESAKQCAILLFEARKELEKRKANLPVVTNLLGLADRMLVPLFSRGFLQLRLQTVLGELRQLKPFPQQDVDAVEYAARAISVSSEEPQEFAGPMGESAKTDDAVELAQTVLKDAVSRIHACDEERLLEDDLQVRRLNAVFSMIVLSWLLLMLAVPVVTTTQRTTSGDVIWPVIPVPAMTRLGMTSETASLLLAALGLSIVGLVGGVISGWIRVRGSRATLPDYRTSMKQLFLRPMVGAVAALTLYLFLDANVVSGVEVTSAGVYVVAAFLAGFSERYFLSIVDPDVSGNVKDKARPAPG